MPSFRPNQRNVNAALPVRRWRAGFSMSEIIMTISILGILATVVILNLGSNYEAIKLTLAQEKVEMLNRGLGERAASFKEYTESAASGAVWDESLLLLTLQYRDPDDDIADLNSPYIDPRYRPKTSASDKDFRLQWNGRRFELLRPGTTGSGLLVAFDGSDYGEPRVYPPDFSTNGR
ncbi:type II secretion system protein [Brevifollis gellanilyticus]|uniref:Prepilin-type N-terminal cleavage/methylation domain-containing protein n=1 Tax=Brevifollis gellanilyticus TaxID=748831 RepID=A0A512ME47_9BACT|nr:type II secretion system protein [Brevifollis gellanilyticus]GEP44978.1 hypothetical protein BGE01nite_42690 [Brevifollis gellanilyticus]